MYLIEVKVRDNIYTPKVKRKGARNGKNKRQRNIKCN